jgi:hypothetical protein
MMQNLRHQDGVAEVAREVLLPSGKRNSVNPLVKLLELRPRQLSIYLKN